VSYTEYQSSFSWRYGRPELRELFSEHMRRRLWRGVWVALATSQNRSGLVTDEELADIQAHSSEIDIEAALKIEHEIGHDLMAEIMVFSDQAKIGGGKIHLGATSMDIEDTVETYRIKRALSLVGSAIDTLLMAFAKAIRAHADVVCMAFTHLQPAEPTTLGYRLSIYAQDLLVDALALRIAFESMTAKGIRGAVGTSASYTLLLEGTGRTPLDQEREVLAAFSLNASEVSTQTYPRKLDYLLLTTLAGVGASLSKFGADMRILSSPGFGELFEPFGKKQVGSSAMPFKRNPIMAERICSLARLLPGYADVAWQNASTNFLERTLDDSANRRTILPESLLCVDEITTLARRIIEGLRVDQRRINDNLRTYGPFSGTEAVMMRAVKAGGNRQELHEIIREAAMQAWATLGEGGDNPLPHILADDERLRAFLDPAEIRTLLDPTRHIGDAAERARRLADKIEALEPFPVMPAP
jgi:adenylosuccinate lyase